MVRMALILMAAMTLGAQMTPPTLPSPAENPVPDWVLTANRGKKEPLNLALVLNCSQGAEKWFTIMRKGAVEMVKNLRPTDCVSVVVLCDDRASVAVPAQPATNKTEVVRKIESFKTKGEAALFAGISMAASEIRRTTDEKHVNRVVVLGGSYGTVGPDSDRDLLTLSIALAKENIRVWMPGRMLRRGMGSEGSWGRPAKDRFGEDDWRPPRKR